MSYKAHLFAREHHLRYRTVRVWRDPRQYARWHFEIEIYQVGRRRNHKILFQWSPAPGWGYDSLNRPSIARTWDNVMCWYTNCLDVVDPRFPPHSEEGRAMLRDWQAFLRLFKPGERDRVRHDAEQIDIEQ